MEYLFDSRSLAALLDADAPLVDSWLVEIYGQREGPPRRHLRALRAFEQQYGPGPVFAIRAPGRINLIGEHIDYVDYFRSRVFPFGSREHDLLLIARPRQDNQVHLATTETGLEPTSFPVEPILAQEWTAYLQGIGVPSTHWQNYIRGTALYLQHRHPKIPLRGLDLLVDSTIPVAGGASSSSALVVTSAAALRLANGLPLDPAEIAEDSSKAEWYVGTRGGKMDHATLCYGEVGNALLITFDPFSVETVPLPVEGYRWVTFYTHPAEKGSAVMSEYNERSLVSRYLIPWLLERVDWSRLRAAIERGDPEDIQAEQGTVETALEALPETMKLEQVATDYPGDLADLRALYPALFEVRGMAAPLKIRNRARHHFGEIARVLEAKRLLESIPADNPSSTRPVMRQVGRLLSETHASLRDLYEISTPDIERVIEIARGCEGVYGARVMGGGFGGNVLVLVEEAQASPLVEALQREYYAPQGRASEGNVMVSSPGQGLQALDPSEVIRQQQIAWANDWERSERHMTPLLASCPPSDRPARLVVVAAGKGQRAKESGLEMPKPLAPVHGVPVIRHMLDRLLGLPVRWETPIAVINPTDEPLIRQALRGYEVDYVRQENPLGTAHAVWAARSLLKGFDGDTIVVWGTQPVIQPQSVMAMLRVHQATGASLCLPTAKRNDPYAPLTRDTRGFIVDSVETHQEGAEPVAYGEDNIGIFCLRTRDLLEALSELHAEMYDEARGGYRTSSGELGFPNQMVRVLARNGRLILGLALADPRETQGIKTKAHLDLVEGYLDALS